MEHTNSAENADISVIERTVWDYLSTNIDNPFAVAGIMGNLYAESELKSNVLQHTYKKPLNATDESYTASVDDGSYQRFDCDSAGYGLAQWTLGIRKKGLLEYARSKGCSISDLNMQLEYLWIELSTDYSNSLKKLIVSASVREASDIILTEFERPADQSEAVQVKRASFGEGYYHKFVG